MKLCPRVQQNVKSSRGHLPFASPVRDDTLQEPSHTRTPHADSVVQKYSIQNRCPAISSKPLRSRLRDSHDGPRGRLNTQCFCRAVYGLHTRAKTFSTAEISSETERPSNEVDAADQIHPISRDTFASERTRRRMLSDAYASVHRLGSRGRLQVSFTGRSPL